MVNAFSVLSLKRNRSNKQKSGFNLFTKISDVIHHQDNAKKRKSFVGIFQYFRNEGDTHKRKPTTSFDNDVCYEYNQYHKRHAERNIHTLPISPSKKLTSILIKRSGTSPITMRHHHTEQLTVLTKVSSRRSNATASNFTVNSEDLTAKEFADMTGIRILPEDNDDLQQQQEEVEEEEASLLLERKLSNNVSNISIEEDLHMQTLSTFKSDRLDSLNETQESRRSKHRLSIASNASMYSHGNNNNNNSNRPKIWDNEFWVNPDITMGRSNSTATHRTINHVIGNNADEPPIMHELRRINSERKADQHCVIKKGRFEIHLGDSSIPTPGESMILPTEGNATATTLFSDQHTVEWKRKRA